MTTPVQALDYQPPPPKKYTVGTLTYTKAGLAALVVWMVWGDLVYTAVEKIFPQSMPLQLSRMGISKGWIPVMMVTMGQLVTMTIGPPLGFISDRTRTRWGRRIPYIVAGLPFLCLTMAALGFTDDIGDWIRRSSLPSRIHLSPTGAIIVFMIAMIAAFNVFNLFVNSMYWCLFADVIPKELMSRFMGIFRVVGAGTGSLFQFYVLEHIETHTRLIYTIGAALYFFGLLLMIWKVREGKYPPPVDNVARQSWTSSVRLYFRECFTHPFYIAFFMSKSLWALSNVCNVVKIYFYKDHLGITLRQIGMLDGIMSLVSLAITLPLAWLADKMHPTRMIMLATVFIIPITFAGYYITDFKTYVIVNIITVPLVAMFDVAELPMGFQLLPRAQYGQFASANGMLRSFTILVSSVFGGLFIAKMNELHGVRGNAYAFLWQGTCEVLGLACLIIVYIYWKRYGGENFDPERVLHVDVDAASEELASQESHDGAR